MPNSLRLDILIVYNGHTAYSASDRNSLACSPFLPSSINASCNTAYAYFLKVCQQLHLTAGFTTSFDITGPGSFRSYWTVKDNVWLKHNSPCHSSTIYDKFSPKNVSDNSLRQLLFSSPKIRPYNDSSMFSAFFDKELTYAKLKDHAIPTIAIKRRTLASIKLASRKLLNIMNTHSGQADFSQDLIMKDRFGAGGWNVYKFKANDSRRMLKVMRQNQGVSFVIQPFAKFDTGFTYNNQTASTDIRLIYINGKIVQSYFRRALPGDFRCNEHQGGSSTFLSRSEIPKQILKKAGLIASILHNQSSLYALDFIVSNSGNIYFIEGNTGPGLSWNSSIKKEAHMGRLLIRQIVHNLAKRITIKLPKSHPLTLPTLLPNIPSWHQASETLYPALTP